MLFRIYRDDIAGVLLDWRQARGLDKVIFFTKKYLQKIIKEYFSLDLIALRLFVLEIIILP